MSCEIDECCTTFKGVIAVLSFVHISYSYMFFLHNISVMKIGVGFKWGWTLNLMNTVAEMFMRKYLWHFNLVLSISVTQTQYKCRVLKLYYLYSMTLDQRHRKHSHNEQNLILAPNPLTLTILYENQWTSPCSNNWLYRGGVFFHLKPHIKPLINKIFSLFSFTKQIYWGWPPVLIN